MKNMKKGLALLLAGIMVLGMTACGAKEETPPIQPYRQMSTGTAR